MHSSCQREGKQPPLSRRCRPPGHLNSAVHRFLQTHSEASNTSDPLPPAPVLKWSAPHHLKSVKQPRWFIASSLQGDLHETLCSGFFVSALLFVISQLNARVMMFISSQPHAYTVSVSLCVICVSVSLSVSIPPSSLTTSGQPLSHISLSVRTLRFTCRNAQIVFYSGVRMNHVHTKA